MENILYKMECNEAKNQNSEYQSEIDQYKETSIDIENQYKERDSILQRDCSMHEVIDSLLMKNLVLIVNPYRRANNHLLIHKIYCKKLFNRKWREIMKF
jgi:hypothetical protein